MVSVGSPAHTMSSNRPRRVPLTSQAPDLEIRSFRSRGGDDASSIAHHASGTIERRTSATRRWTTRRKRQREARSPATSVAGASRRPRQPPAFGPNRHRGRDAPRARLRLELARRCPAPSGADTPPRHRPSVGTDRADAARHRLAVRTPGGVRCGPRGGRVRCRSLPAERSGQGHRGAPRGKIGIGKEGSSHASA